jgi:DegV family protein with EDD domain
MRIVADSGCDMPKDMSNNSVGLGITELREVIELVPLTMTVDGTEFVDDNALDIADYMVKMEASKKAVRTAAPSPKQYLEKFMDSGSVFVVTLSSKVSASYESAMAAKKQYLEEIGNKFIHVFDSFSAASAQTLVSLKINEFIKKNLTENEIVTKVSEYIGSMSTYFVLEKYDNAVKNGRMSPYVAKIAGLFSINPICAAVDGKMEVIDKARGVAKTMSKLVDKIANKNVDFENRILAISHASCLEKALEYKRQILAKVKFKDILITETSGLCSTYAERGGIIISF